MRVLFRRPTEEEIVYINMVMEEIPDDALLIVRIDEREPDETGFGYYERPVNGNSIGVIAVESDGKIQYRGLATTEELWYDLKGTL